MGFRSWRFPSLSTPNINEASSKDISVPLHRNVLPLGTCRGQEEKEKGYLRGVTSCDRSQTDGASYRVVSNLFRTASVPDVTGANQKSAFTSITISARKVPQTSSRLLNTISTSRPTWPMRTLTPQEPLGSGAISATIHTVRASNSQPDLCRQNHKGCNEEYTQSYSTMDGVAMRGPEKRKAQPQKHRHSYTEGDRNQDWLGDSTLSRSSPPFHRSCLQFEVNPKASVVFLDKSLSISLIDLEGRRVTQPTLHRSTLSIRLGVSSQGRLSLDNKPAKMDGVYARSKGAVVNSNKCSGREDGWSHFRGTQSKQWGHKVEKIAPSYGVISRADDSDRHRRDTTLGLLSFREPSPSNMEANRRDRNADETAGPTQSNFRHRQHTFNFSPVESRLSGRRSEGERKEDPHRHGGPREESGKVSAPCQGKTCYYPSLDFTHKTLSLKQALELFKPDFISRSQDRVNQLEQRARRRRALQNSNPDLVQGLGEDGGKRRRNCTTPHPLSDNLFKPRERSISGREMHLRSRRIYNKLPEVTKKKEEEKKRAVSQTNRLRAELFKKKLLEQILQR